MAMTDTEALAAIHALALRHPINDPKAVTAFVQQIACLSLPAVGRANHAAAVRLAVHGVDVPAGPTTPDDDTGVVVNAVLGTAAIQVANCKHGQPKNAIERAENAILDRAIAQVNALKGDASR